MGKQYTGQDIEIGELFTATHRHYPLAGIPAHKGRRFRATKITRNAIETDDYRFRFEQFNFKRIGK
jgi:hypothetical protein